ncbi:T9SS type B sorting domain-containing protein [Aestuariibaculum lutulentum]|uniref:T9SS type B sorting domain-containing protein n=1 Tax=Aestuariibaculum lutulentum TaxID=2920935 RepID=A0ABS9RL07_9FLAO|nr:T9SS type B sorting domain-containing protein [Aestuariibaculum lutulentum]MCH4553633.1 T9SS type B sorting domain-containing protein [Aestuariibaculum lutulentum]
MISQNETDNWYFGDNAGLNFGNIKHLVLNDGAMTTPAGCSSISNKNGELLFYTNGQTVWNKNHEIMSNGINLAGDINNTQSTIIVPKPSDPNTYYIFTTRENPTSTPLVTSGLFFSTVKFTVQNPLGEITSKNSRLTTTITQRITAIHDAITNTIKVITFGSESTQNNAPKDTFFIFTVTSNGVNKTPVKTQERTIVSSAGAMKISPDGKIIALADFDGNFIYLYNFDITTSEVKYYNTINPNLLMDPLNPYGVEFSQDSKILYFTGNNAYNRSFLYKFLLYEPSIFNSKKLVSTTTEYSYGDLQLAKNGKIYVANYLPTTPPDIVKNINVINTPKNEDDSGFSAFSINLETGASLKGLPLFVSSFFRNRIITENQCAGIPFTFTTDSYMPIDSILWEFGDGNTSSERSPAYTYTNDGNYIVKATIFFNNEPFEIYKDIQVYENPKIENNEVLTQCDTDNDAIAIFNLNNIRDKISNYRKTFELSFYYSNEDAQNDMNRIKNIENYTNRSNPEELFVKITTLEGCYTISNFYLETTFNNLPYIEEIYSCEDADGIFNNSIGLFDLNEKEDKIRNQLTIPETSTLIFYPTLEDAQTKTNSLGYTHKTQTSTLWVRIETPDNSCAGIGSFNAIVNSPIETNLEKNYTICSSDEDIIFNLDGGKSNDIWEWKNNEGNIISSNQKINLNTPGDYSLTVYKTENAITCSKTEYFSINKANQIEIKSINAENYQISISVEGQSNYEFSIDGIHYFGNGNEYLFTNVEAGIYTVQIKDINNCEFPAYQKVSFIGFPKYFTPNNDGVNDFWKIEGVDSDFYISANIDIYDRYGKFLYSMNIDKNLIGWDGTFNGTPLTSNDYWFKAILTDHNNETFIKTGHFSLKR